MRLNSLLAVLLSLCCHQTAPDESADDQGRLHTACCTDCVRELEPRPFICANRFFYLISAFSMFFLNSAGYPQHNAVRTLKRARTRTHTNTDRHAHHNTPLPLPEAEQ